MQQQSETHTHTDHGSSASGLGLFLAPLAKGSSSAVRASVNSFLVSAKETTFLNQSGPNLHEVFMGTRSRMSSIVSEICPITPVLLPLK